MFKTAQLCAALFFTGNTIVPTFFTNNKNSHPIAVRVKFAIANIVNARYRMELYQEH